MHDLTRDPFPWLLDPADPGPRYLALRDLICLPADAPELIAARTAAHRAGPIAQVLAAMDPTGFWLKGGPGYAPKYRSGVWALLLLAQLGASVDEDARIATACTYLLDHNLTRHGQFSATRAPSGTIDCLQGNLCWALAELGCTDPRLARAFDWLVRSVTGEGVAPIGDQRAPLRYDGYKSGPGFQCGANNHLECAWGGVKVLLALGKLPAATRSPEIERAIRHGIDFFLRVDPATAAYPNGYADKPNAAWWQLGFPVFYITDILQIVEALVALGYGEDPRLANALALVRSKADRKGRWPLEYAYHDKTWIDFGRKGQPGKWTTIRALRALGVGA